MSRRLDGGSNVAAVVEVATVVTEAPASAGAGARRLVMSRRLQTEAPA
jgi:hypothetical protein